MLDHLIDSKDVNLLLKCMYCGNGLDDRKSEFLENNHYKTIDCSGCGKTHTTKVDFLGSGHDNWYEELKEKLQKL